MPGQTQTRTANTKRCFSEFIGQKVIGTLFDALPVSRTDIAGGTKTLIFEDGRGLTIASNGSYWIDSAEAVRAAINRRRDELGVTQREIEGVLHAAGATASLEERP